MRVAGVDGTKGGWVAVVLENGSFLRDEHMSDVSSDFARLADVEVLAIDVPVGFGPRDEPPMRPHARY